MDVYELVEDDSDHSDSGSNDYKCEAQNSNAVRYVVRFPAPQTHYVSVEALLPTAGQPEVEIFMPVWTPGSYLVREYARNIEAISVSDQAGKPLAFVEITQESVAGRDGRRGRDPLFLSGLLPRDVGPHELGGRFVCAAQWRADLRDAGWRPDAAARRASGIAASMENDHDRAAGSSRPATRIII